MDITTYAAWLEADKQNQDRMAAIYPEAAQRHREAQEQRDQERNRLLAQFPYSVIAEGLYDEHDYAGRWCWQNISPMNGPCIGIETSYPACPLVLATEYSERRVYQGKEYFKKQYHLPVEHEHQGKWTCFWFGKTGYDYGLGEYYFAHEADRAQFLTAFPTFTWDESWDRPAL